MSSSYTMKIVFTNYIFLVKILICCLKNLPVLQTIFSCKNIDLMSEEFARKGKIELT